MRHFSRWIVLLGLATLAVSCADTPTAPKATVHLSGVILDRNGLGMQAVYVDFVEAAPYEDLDYPFIPAGATFVHAVTNSRGRYEADVPEGNYKVWLTAPGFTGYLRTTVRTIVRRGDRGLDYQFRYVRLALQPTIAGGQSVSDAFAIVRSENYFNYVVALHAGNELEAYVAPGTYSVEMRLAGDGYAYPGQQFQVQVVGDTTVAVGFGGNPVTAHVIGPGGAPISGARINVGLTGPDASGFTNAAGDLLLYLPNGAASFGIYSPDASIMSREFPFVPISGSASLTFDLDGTRWTGTVRLSGNGSPLANVPVIVTAWVNREVAYTTTDLTGSFQVVVRPNWAHRIEIEDFAVFDNVIAGADSTLDLVVTFPPALPSSPLRQSLRGGQVRGHSRR